MEMSDRMKKARATLIVLFSIYLLLDMGLAIASGNLPSLARPFLTGVLFYFLLEGKRWAYWIYMALFCLTLALCVAAAGYLAFKGDFMIAAIVVAGFAVIVLPIPCFLLFSNAAKEYLAYKRSISSNNSLQARRP